MSTALVAGLLGLVGTLLGAGLTTWTVRQTAARSDQRVWLETRREEFRSAVTQFASALLVYRLAEADRWGARRRGRKDEAAEREAYRQRAAMLDALYVLELSSDSDQLKKLARSAVDMAHHIREASDEDEMGRRTHDVRDVLEKVIVAARRAEPGRFRPGETKD
jgi:hypothetical protein